MLTVGTDEPFPASALTESEKPLSCTRPFVESYPDGRSPLGRMGGSLSRLTVPRARNCCDSTHPSPDAPVQTVASGAMSRLVNEPLGVAGGATLASVAMRSLGPPWAFTFMRRLP